MHCLTRLSHRACLAGSLLAISVFLGRGFAWGADLREAQDQFLRGNYADCLRLSSLAISNSTWNSDWPVLLVKAQLAVGRYREAEKTITNALERWDYSIPLRLLAYEVFNANGRTNRAAQMLDELGALAGSRVRSSREPADLVALGRATLLLNADPKLVLDNFFDQAKRADPKCREAYLAGGELALDKHDYALAAKVFTDAAAAFPKDPDVEFGLARAYASSDREEMAGALESVLTHNSNHVAALVLMADQLLDAEEYGEADKMLDRALAVNPWHPDAWAYRAVLAHLRNDAQAESAARSSGLKYWESNPRVDYLIGRKLSQKYRFAEGATFQRQALAFAPGYLPAMVELAQNLLRLGNEKEGWQMAGQVHAADGYDVTAFNLVTLGETMGKFQTLTNADFIVRMSGREVSLYGDRVLALLGRAKAKLSEKYGQQLAQPTVVEIFPEQKDFGVRTFGMPENPGYLGVCFGRVITANSPASQAAHPANWEAVLWHEFCHVITLQLTRNRMPRWLSEGISVYEERQENPTWGQAMTPHYREMILGGELTPMSGLSGAFLSSKDDQHIQFAYFESALVVDYLVRTYGLGVLKDILRELGDGVMINRAIVRHTAPMAKLEEGFAAFARGQAEQLGPGLDWTRPAGSIGSAGPETSVLDHYMRRRVPKPPVSTPPASQGPSTKPNYWDLVDRAKAAREAKRWSDVETTATKLIDLYPNDGSADSGYVFLATAYHGLSQTNQERQVLAKLATLEDSATDVFQRLMELDEAMGDWRGVAENAKRFLAVNPLLPSPYRGLASASEVLGNVDEAIRSDQRLLLLDPPDPAEVHFRLARLWWRKGDATQAKRQVLQALEEAPRFREAQRLLLEIEGIVAPPAGT